MERYLCIHGHFYQPPRDNPWLEAIEIQNSAYPYHDWNEKISAECYAPNSASRILDGKNRILRIMSNYTKISFNFGPTLLSWMEEKAPEVYQAILEADKQSAVMRSGHGNAIAQCYNHVIMPLANARDKCTQIIWGIKDFEHRFGRFPEGMWLPETATDLETLDILAEQGIKFTILSQHQASKARAIGSDRWRDVKGGLIDPTRAYLCRLSSGRSITIFFYDGAISHGIAFEQVLNRGEDFASRLLNGFSDKRNWPQFLNVATDGETYGHHHRFGEMALTHALNVLESKGRARLTNYGEYLERHPPAWEAEIIENTSWSCVHGVERWKSNCGCSSGAHPKWSQQWRGPLREALDWLREQLLSVYEKRAREYLKDPWGARDEYVRLVLDRSAESVEQFIRVNQVRDLSDGEHVAVLKLLEMQRQALLMYTSCGWFFDDVGGLETIQIIEYAGRAIQLSEELSSSGSEKTFIEKLARAKSNDPELKDGASIYEKFVRPSAINLKKVGVHYAVSSLFEEYADRAAIYCYEIERDAYLETEAGRARLAVGKINVGSKIVREWERITFCVFYLGGQSLSGGVRTFQGEDDFQLMKSEITEAFEKGALTDIMLLMDKHFGMHTYSLHDLFRDEQRKILELLISSTLEEFETAYRQMYYNSRILMGFLQDAGMPIPKAFYAAAELALNLDLRRALGEKPDIEQIEEMILQIRRWDVPVNEVDLEFTARHRIEAMMRDLCTRPSDLSLLITTSRVIALLKELPVDMNVWETQNVYYQMAGTTLKERAAKAAAGDEEAAAWIEEFKHLGQLLSFNTDVVLRPG
jgi:alpha-amylase/alpha-mannosidase (GH57 family)